VQKVGKGIQLASMKISGKVLDAALQRRWKGGDTQWGGHEKRENVWWVALESVSLGIAIGEIRRKGRGGGNGQ